MIPYVREMDFAYGVAQQISPLIRRVVANNPGPFTFKGTGTYIVGQGEVAVIDPGPRDDNHLRAILRATAGETITAILVTHDHADHAPLAQSLAEVSGAKIIGCAPHPDAQSPPMGVEEGLDRLYRPDRTPFDGDVVRGPGWALRAVTTPGHTANHICFALEQEHALFSGDHVMGWSTTVVAPPDGNMTDYYASLRKVIGEDFRTLWPTHGPPVTEPGPFLQAYLAHRLEREAQIVGVLGRGPAMIDALVGEIYVGLDPRLQRAAAASVLAHLFHLIRVGKVVSDGRPGRESSFALAN